jgi:hypothetical protein
MTSETLVNSYQTTQRYNPEDSHLCTHRPENLKSNILYSLLKKWANLTVQSALTHCSFYVFRCKTAFLIPNVNRNAFLYSVINNCKFYEQNIKNVKMAVLWDVASCILVDIDLRFRGAYCLHYQGNVGGNKYLWNVDQYLPDCTVQHPRRLPSSYSSPWDSEISPIKNLVTKL